MSLPKSFYVCDNTSVIQGPFDAEELCQGYYGNGFDREALVNFDGEWLPIAGVVSGVEQLQKEAALGRFLDQELSQYPPPEVRSLTFLDLAVIGLFWWWYWASHWQSVGAMAITGTAWIVGGLLRAGGSAVVAGFGHLIQGFGGWLGSGALIWLVIDLFLWLF